jgi:hypothetical protein
LSLQNHLLEMDAKKAPAPTWETVRYMISCIQYGGRITDDFDQLLMDTFAEKYFHQGVLQVRDRVLTLTLWCSQEPQAVCITPHERGCVMLMLMLLQR